MAATVDGVDLGELVGVVFGHPGGNCWRVLAVEGEEVKVHQVDEDGRLRGDPVSGSYWWHWSSLNGCQVVSA